MNKLIDKIVDRTAVEIPGVCQLEYESGGSGVEFSNPALEKFVELIVRECVSQCRDVGNVIGAMDAGEDGRYKAVAGAYARALKEHFGVNDEQEY
jgi:hypothetical protein